MPSDPRSQDPASRHPRPGRVARQAGEPGPSSDFPPEGPGGTPSPLLQGPTCAGAAGSGPAGVAAPGAAISSSQQSRERTGARTPDPDTGTADPAYLPAVPVRVRAQDPGSALPASRAEPGQVPGSAPDASALPAGPAARTFTIALPPGLALLSLNDRHHWAARYRRSQALKEAAWAMALKGKIPRLERAFIAAVWQPPNDWRERDADNPVASVKAAIDGIVAAKVLPGDECPRYVTGVYCTIGEPFPGGRLVLSLLPHDPMRELIGLAGLRGAT